MIEYTVALPPFAPSFVRELHALAVQVFGGCKRERLEWHLSRMPDPSVQIARTPELAGFKLGYAVAPHHYYSWLGGVGQEHQRQGVARRLMQNQHRWARSRGYREIETRAVQSNTAMVTLNLEAGFRVMGSYARDSEPRVIMIKNL